MDELQAEGVGASNKNITHEVPSQTLKRWEQMTGHQVRNSIPTITKKIC